MKNLKFTYLPVFLLTAGFSGLASANGFYAPYASVSDLGTGLGGGAALAEDASGNFLNSAGIMRVKNPQVVMSGVGIYGPYKFTGTMSNPGVFSPITETGSTRSFSRGLVPAMHFVYPINSKMSAALSVVAPLGLGINYPSDSLVRYDVIYLKEGAVNIGPSFAYQVNPQLSLGIGPDAYYYGLKQKAAVRTQLLTLTDSYGTAEVSNWAYGYHLGALYQATPATRVGLSYRSSFIERLSGNSKFYIAGDGNTVSNNTKFKFPFGSITTLSALTEMTPRWAMMGTVQFFAWSFFQWDHIQNVATPVPGVTTNIVAPEKLRNTWLAALGSTYQLTDKFMLRGGVHIVTSATRPPTQGMLLPDPIIMGGVVAFRYNMDKTTAIDMTYQHAFNQDVSIHHTTAATGNVLNGTLQSSADSVGMQVTWSFA